MSRTDLTLASTTTEDLVWWLERIHELDWVFAVTYAEGAPHEYVTAGRSLDFTPDDCVRAARVIRTFGEPAKFFSTTRTYLEDADGWKYWDMAGDDVRNSGIINRGRVDHVYGVQNAARTRSQTSTAYDPVATEWDRVLGATDEERHQIVALIDSLGTFTNRRVLDIGCGTGLALDLKITQSVRYVAIDPSQAMLNDLVRKYPHLAGVHSMTFKEAIRRRVLNANRFDLVLALGGSASYLSDSDLESIATHASGPRVLSVYASGHGPFVGDLDAVALAAARDRLVANTAVQGGKISRVGRFDVAVISPR